LGPIDRASFFLWRHRLAVTIGPTLLHTGKKRIAYNIFVENPRDRILLMKPKCNFKDIINMNRRDVW
jgi:hypothetical protein